MNSAAKAATSGYIPLSGVLLHRRDRPSRGEHENPVLGSITEFTKLGANTSVTLALANEANTTLNFTVPSHVAQRNYLASGASVGVSLLADSIHMMKLRSEPQD